MGAPKGNKYAEKWTEEDAMEAFLKALHYAQTDEDCLCMQDAVFESGMPSSSFYRQAEKGEVWESIKKDINSAIIRRVNKGSIRGKFQAAPSIWRMKQLGETDKKVVDATVNSPSLDSWLGQFDNE